eukprot:5735218-Pyramimonas_sp.AAC.1
MGYRRQGRLELCRLWQRRNCPVQSCELFSRSVDALANLFHVSPPLPTQARTNAYGSGEK